MNKEKTNQVFTLYHKIRLKILKIKEIEDNNKLTDYKIN